MRNFKVYKLRIFLTATIAIFVGSVLANHQSEKTINERTQATGSVYVEGDKVPAAAPVVVKTTSARTGDQVYTEKCAMCHAGGIAGAPKLGEASAWSARVAQGEATLFEHAINGYQGAAGFMPAKGGCTDCGDEEVKAAVKYMLGKLK